MIDFDFLTLEKLAEKKKKAEESARISLENYLKDEKVNSIYRETKKLAFEISKKQFEGNETEDLEKEFKAKKEEFKLALKNIGGSVLNIKPKYSCNICQDRGYLKDKKCECFNRIKNEILLENAGFNKSDLPTFESSNFEVFKDEKVREKAQILYELLSKFVDKLETSKIKTILITGLVGVGKTHLLECVVSKAVSKNYFVNYTTAFNFNQDMLSCHLADLKDKKIIMDKYLNCDLLCIDDLGTENILKNVTVEYLYLVLSERLNRGKPIIITTNLSMEQIENVYDDRILSRLTHKLTGLFINFEGKDLRQSR